MASKTKNILESVLSDRSISKYIDDGSIVTGGEEEDEGDVMPFVTRFPSLNLMIGIGGIPKGKIVEISGEEGACKSAICWAICGDVQRQGKIAAWIDAEQAIDFRVPKQRKFIKSLGCDYREVIIVRPETAEMGFTIANALASNPDVGIVVYDSIVALANQREDNAEITKEDRNTLPQTINKGLRKCAKSMRKTDCTMLIINQLRENTERMGPYDKKWKTTGGKGLKHWASLRIFVFKQLIKNSDKEVIGICPQCRIEKTRFDVPRDNAKMFYYYNRGFDIAEEIFDLAVIWGILEKSGNSYVYDGEKKTKAKWLEFFETEEGKETLDEILETTSDEYNAYYDGDDEADVDEDLGEDEEGDEDDE